MLPLPPAAAEVRAVDIPVAYTWLRKELPFDAVSYGSLAIELYPVEALEAQQVGYAMDPAGRSLCSRERGGWNPSWLVIGHENRTGRPLILDRISNRIMSLRRDDDAWRPQSIAVSPEALKETLRRIVLVAFDRDCPEALEDNPLPERFLNEVLSEISRLNPGIGTEYWESFLKWA